MIYIFLLPHTLKVNELPSHTHTVPGYIYGSLGSSYSYMVNMIESESQRITVRGRVIGQSKNSVINVLYSFSTSNYEKMWRKFELGVPESGETTSQGNNESHKKTTQTGCFNFIIELQ